MKTPHPMPAATEPWPERVLVSPELADKAEATVRAFPGCFWFRHPEARVRYRDDVTLVIEHLRDYGDKQAWAAAQELRRCL